MRVVSPDSPTLEGLELDAPVPVAVGAPVLSGAPEPLGKVNVPFLYKSSA